MLSARTRKLAILIILIASLLLAACDSITVRVELTPSPDEPQPTATIMDNDVTPSETTAPTQMATEPAPTSQPTSTVTQPDDEDSTSPSPTSPPDANAPLQSPPADWVTYVSKGYGVTFRVPPDWVLKEGDEERLSGPDGYAVLDAVGGEGVSDVMDVCRQQAEHVLRPYGTSPEIQSIISGESSGMPGCLIIPDADAGMGDEHMAAIAYPQPKLINGLPYDYVVIYATGHHIRAIISSLQFVNETAQIATPTPTPTLPPDADPSGTPADIQRFEVTPLQSVARGDGVDVTWEAQGYQAVLCQEFVRSYGGSGLQSSTCEDVPLDGRKTINMPQDSDTFYVEVELLVSTTSETVSEVQTVQLACEHDWFFSSNVPSACPVYEAFVMDAVAQRFERGWMIYVEDMVGSPLDNMYVLFDVDGVTGPGSSERYTLFQNPTLVDTPDSIQPPEGLLAPADLFFSIWDVHGIAQAGPDGKQGIGWAVSKPVAYQVNIQNEFPPQGDPRLGFMSGPDGQIFALDADEDAPASAGLVGQWYLRSQE